MAFGARGSLRDFGMKGGLALPVIERENYAASGQLMPPEKKGRKKHFSVEQEELEKDGSSRKRQSIADRIRNWLKKKPEPPPPDYERSTLPSRPNSAQLAPIKEQVEDEDEKKDVVDGEVENPPASQPKADMSADKVVVRSNNRAQDRSKAYSTAFEHTSPTSQEVPTIDKVHLTLQNPGAGPHKVVLQRRLDDDSFGFHLSGGQPPITITYVKPKSVAHKRGVKVGDVVLDLNGINCRKRVEISQLMKMKFMFQQPRRSSTDEQSGSNVKTSVSKSQPSKQQGIGDPLATSSPIKSAEASEHGESANGSKKKRKKRRSTELQGDESYNEVSVTPPPASVPEATPVSVDKKSKGKKKKTKAEALSLSSTEEAVPKEDAVVRDRKKGDKKKKKRLSAIESSENEDNANGASHEPVILSVDVEPAPTPSVEEDEVKDEVEDILQEIEELSTMQEEELNLHKKDRNRRSTSPKSRYQMDANGAPEDQTDEEIPISKKKKTKKGTKEATAAAEDQIDGEITSSAKKQTKKTTSEVKPKKKKKADSATDGEVSVQEKGKKKKSTPSKKSNKKKVDKDESEVPEELPILSAAVSGSFESDTMEFVPKKREINEETADKGEDENMTMEDSTSKDLPKKSKKKKKKGDDLDHHERTQSLKREKKKKTVSPSQSASAIRRGSVDQGVTSSKHSMSNSQSFSSIEEQKKFREELKEASKSEHNLVELVGSLDSNLKVKKSGLVKGKSTSSSRPSIFNQSSSPEPEMTSMNSLSTSEKEFEQERTTEDDVPDPNFKLKKSGVVVGRKTSAGGARPSILDEQSNTAYSDVLPGEMKYNKDVEMDLTSVPQVAPSLGLIAGRDRRDANNRSLTKRRPPSFRQNSKEEEAEDYQASTTSRMAAAKKLFENKGEQESTRRINGRPLSKSVEKPPKALGVLSESTMASKVQDKPAPCPVSSWANKAPSADATKENSGPSWVSRAQGVHQCASTTPQPPKTDVTPQPPKTVPPTASPSKDGIPSVGHVAARLAMFQ